jgi:hypothetical protein
MWTASNHPLSGARGLQFRLSIDSQNATVTDVLNAWQHDQTFRSFFNALLADAPYSAFRWETPPVTSATLAQPFEFVLLDSPGLARVPDPHAFSEHFGRTRDGVAVFSNLGGDAAMVVPTPFADHKAYCHLAAFVRLAPEAQRHALWQAVGAAMSKRVSDRPVWLSTAGAGVSWLHVRLDDRPKYYGFASYRQPNTDDRQPP